MTFDRSKSTHHQTMRTLEQHPKTEIVKAYSVKSTEKQRKQTTSETSTMYTSNFNTPESTSFEADSRGKLFIMLFYKYIMCVVRANFTCLIHLS